MVIQHPFGNFWSSKISCSEPNDFRRDATNDRQVKKVGIESNDGKTMQFGKRPNIGVVAVVQTCRLHVPAIGKNRQVKHRLNTKGYILVEKQFHHSHQLHSSFSLSGERKTGKNILPGKFREIGKNIVECHISRQPTQNIVHRDTGIPHARFSEAFFGINSDNIVKTVHNNLRLIITAQKYK